MLAVYLGIRIVNSAARIHSWSVQIPVSTVKWASQSQAFSFNSSTPRITTLLCQRDVGSSLVGSIGPSPHQKLSGSCSQSLSGSQSNGLVGSGNASLSRQSIRTHVAKHKKSLGTQRKEVTHVLSQACTVVNLLPHNSKRLMVGLGSSSSDLDVSVVDLLRRNLRHLASMISPAESHTCFLYENINPGSCAPSGCSPVLMRINL